MVLEGTRCDNPPTQLTSGGINVGEVLVRGKLDDQKRRKSLWENVEWGKGDYNNGLYGMVSSYSEGSDSESYANDDCDEDNTDDDGGWGWLVCFAAFVSNVVVDGTVFSFGVLFAELVKVFGGSKCQTALVGSVMVGTHLFVG